MKLANLADAFHDELCDVVHAEKQLLKTLPTLAKYASAKKLSDQLYNCSAETEMQLSRLKMVFEGIGKGVKPKRSEAMTSLLLDAKKTLDKSSEPQVLDALLIAALQKIQHYRITVYGTLCTWAVRIGENDAQKLLRENLLEAVSADKALSKLSKKIYKKASGLP